MAKILSDKRLLQGAWDKINELNRCASEMSQQIKDAEWRTRSAENERAKWESRFDALLRWGKS